ncbi:uncharacterized protein LOC135828423 isoform X3 [Sycon ciliatum]|uniref:uncharacterized protein LOC135828423 isoform X3 n=1 Tax=Sycon ciliatum TaxID=27933 RepID=UPI0031F6EADA
MSSRRSRSDDLQFTPLLQSEIYEAAMPASAAARNGRPSPGRIRPLGRDALREMVISHSDASSLLHDLGGTLQSGPTTTGSGAAPEAPPPASSAEEEFFFDEPGEIPMQDDYMEDDGMDPGIVRGDPGRAEAAASQPPATLLRRYVNCVASQQSVKGEDCNEDCVDCEGAGSDLSTLSEEERYKRMAILKPEELSRMLHLALLKLLMGSSVDLFYKKPRHAVRVCSGVLSEDDKIATAQCFLHEHHEQPFTDMMRIVANWIYPDPQQQQQQQKEKQSGKKSKAEDIVIYLKKCIAKITVEALLLNLLKMGFDVQSIQPTANKNGPYHYAANARLKDIMQLLIEHGIQGIESLDDTGHMPVEKMLKILLDPQAVAVDDMLVVDQIASLLIDSMTGKVVRNLFQGVSYWREVPSDVCHLLDLDEQVLDNHTLPVYNFYLLLTMKAGKGSSEHRARAPQTCASILKGCMVQDMTAKTTTFDLSILEADSEGHQPATVDYNPTNTVFQEVLKNKDLRSTDPARVLLHLKWNLYGWSYAMERGILFFLLVLTYSFAFFAAAHERVSGYESPQHMHGNPLEYRSSLSHARAACEVIIILNAFFSLYMHITKVMHAYMLRNGRAYFQQPSNWSQWITIGTVFTLVVLRITNSDAQWYLASVFYTFTVLRLLFTISFFEPFGIYMQIIVKMIVRDVTKFSLVYIISILAVTGGLYLSLVATTTNTLPTGTELDADPVLLGTYGRICYSGFRTLVGSGISQINYIKGFNFLSVALIIAFLYSTSLFLNSILVAQLSETYQAVANEAQSTLESTWAMYIRRCERMDGVELLENTFGNSSILVILLRFRWLLGIPKRHRVKRLSKWKNNSTFTDQQLQEMLGNWEKPANRLLEWTEQLESKSKDKRDADLSKNVRLQLEQQKVMQAQLTLILSHLGIPDTAAAASTALEPLVPTTPPPSQPSAGDGQS